MSVDELSPEARLTRLELQIELLQLELEERRMANPSPIDPPAGSIIEDSAKVDDDGTFVLDPEYAETDYALLAPADRRPPYKAGRFDTVRNLGGHRCGYVSMGSSPGTAGKSYIKVHNNLSMYDMEWILRPYPEPSDNYERLKRGIYWQFRISALTIGEGYISNFYDNGSYSRIGTIGVKLYYASGTTTLGKKVHSSWVYRPVFNSWGNEWLRCGYDYFLRFDVR